MNAETRPHHYPRPARQVQHIRQSKPLRQFHRASEHKHADCQPRCFHFRSNCSPPLPNRLHGAIHQHYHQKIAEIGTDKGVIVEAGSNGGIIRNVCAEAMQRCRIFCREKARQMWFGAQALATLFRMKKVLLLLLFLSLLGNSGLVWFANRQYVETAALRLDPLQLDIYHSPVPPKVAGKQRAVFFGDSRALSWSAPAIEQVEFLNRGIGNQTSEQIRLRFAEHIAPLHADILILQLCVNDLKAIALLPQRRDAIVAQCERNILSIIAAARAAGSRVILTTVFPLGKVPPERALLWSDAIAPALREVNRFIAAQAGDGVTVFDAFTVLQGEPDLIRPEYSRDLLHLNARGYEVLNQHLQVMLASAPH